ncbi:MAG TPA: iron-sulfur cluster assembly protein, partial [Phycisphaerae bacterium]|nr:iron-sulfur cluster assembly protein [Phycisphaerae bacterium]
MTESPLLRERIHETLRSIRDPEIPVNIVELGLIYNLDISETGEVGVRMTLTTPNCPVAGDLLREVEQKVRAVEGVKDAKVELVWEPPWQ